MLRLGGPLAFLLLAACSAGSSQTDDTGSSAGGAGGAGGADAPVSNSNDQTVVSPTPGATPGDGAAGGAGSIATNGAGGGALGSGGGPSLSVDASVAKDGAGLDGSGPDDGKIGYDPCPKKGTPCAVMPVGDSITQGLCGWTGYRGSLFHLANQDGKLLTYVGSLLDGPDTVDNKPFPKQHEGHSGFTIDGGGGRDGIKGMITGVMTKYKPNIVLLMIGTNDVDLSVDSAPNRLGSLLDTILDQDPSVLLVVAQIVPQTDDVANVRVRAYNAAIPDLVQTRAAAGKHIAMVDMYSAFVQNPNFKNDLMCDRLHPKGPAYEIMASTWYAAIGPSLK